ncbi:glycosyltransferase family 2 protein [Pontibaca sp. S1109L]|uniref:Glycosyltransferase family 2 protein n=2 Tax=Pontibaca salina TaxID=2795731 RepID=A0A934HU31_9RHOB|nr:glycosyltransferase family 2 protein [Pontibaca salina]
MPVYNGADFLGQAIDSVLDQDFQDFELIIADNASTDKTAEICRAYAEKDPRIKFVRHPRNIGAAKNYNYVFHCAAGEYFNWLAHDDILGPDFLSACLAQFARSTHDTLLVYPTFTFVDENTCETREEVPVCVQSTAVSAPRRMYEVLDELGVVTSVFGMFRRKALGQTRLIGSFIGSDYVLLVESALLGKIIRVGGDPRFMRRLHDKGSQRANRTADERAKWFDPEIQADRRPTRRLTREYLNSILSLPGLTVYERIGAIALLINQRIRGKYRVWARRFRRNGA